MSQRRRRRPVLAALLTFLQPGLGHLYLREWLRTVAWGGLWFGTLAAVVRTAGIDLGPVELIVSVAGLFATIEALTPEAVLGLFAVTTFATLDAYWIAARNNRRLDSGVGRCPRCDAELDPALGFCHWCTTRFDDEPVESDP